MSHHNSFKSQSEYDRNQTKMKALKKDYKEKIISKEKLYEIFITKFHFGGFMAYRVINNWDDEIEKEITFSKPKRDAKGHFMKKEVVK